MNEKQDKLDRRSFLKALGIGGVTTAMTFFTCKSENDSTGEAEAAKTRKRSYPSVPKRKLGKTGIKVPILSHGIMYNLLENQIVLHKGLQWGVNYWDSAHSYAGGNSERGIGKFLKKNPNKRKDLFLVSKASGADSVSEIEQRLQTSLKRMNTSYIDLYYGVHAMSDPDDLTGELRDWAKSAKKRKLIKHFGFTTHRNMAQCLKKASKLDWIDAIMTSYNFRLMQDNEMQDAVEACHRKNIGLVAMKVLGHRIKTDGDKKLVSHFLKKGYTEGQAKIKAVLDDKRISSACITMQSVALLTSNVAAALDKTKLSRADRQVLDQFAQRTCDSYCIGCGYICESAMPEAPFISDVLRYLMYYNSYGDTKKAKQLYTEIPATQRKMMAHLDYGRAEARCPQGIPIGSMISEAVQKLS